MKTRSSSAYAPMTNDLSFIAGSKTADDWRAFRPELIESRDFAAWKKAFADYFHARLDSRYFRPIRTLQKHGAWEGEGFSILAIQCSLIEFLESTVRGLKYRFLRRGEALGPHEYSSSRDIYVTFLMKRAPFASQFNEDLANAFYADIRCGVLHEARTKNGWRVWAKSPTDRIMDTEARIIFRDDLQLALKSFVEWYSEALCVDAELQNAFVRKFDDLCD